MLGPVKLRLLDQPILVSLEDLVPQDSFYRHLDRSLNLAFVRDLVRDSYAESGRPSIDPIVFFKLQLVMFFERIYSERELIRIAADRLSVRWYLGYHFHEPLPDHSSLTRIRERYGLPVFRRFFEAIVEQCQQAKLVWGKELYFDGTKVEANASLDSAQPRFAVEAHLQRLFEAGDCAGAEATQPVASTEARNCGMDCPAATAPEPLDQVPAIAIPLPVTISEESRETLEEANGQRHDWIAREGRPDRQATHGHWGYQRRSDFVASATDPDAALMHRKSGGAHFGYHDHYVVDGGKSRIIVNVLVTPADVMDNQPMLDLLWRTRFRWQLWPRQVTGDTKYGTLENIIPIENAHIRAYLPLPDLDKRTPFFGQAAFRYDAQRNVYVCPQGAELRFFGRMYTERIIRYRGESATCNACPVKGQCTTGSKGRVVTRSFDEHYLDRVRAYHATEPYKKAIEKRKVWVEPLFAEAKEWHGLRRFRLRTLWKVNVEAMMVATGQNLKRLLSKRGWGRRRWPGGVPSLALSRCLQQPCLFS